MQGRDLDSPSCLGHKGACGDAWRGREEEEEPYQVAVEEDLLDVCEYGGHRLTVFGLVRQERPVDPTLLRGV